MARLPRLVVPNYPHHDTQRGNRRQTTFFSPKDYLNYLQRLADKKEEFDVAIWAYCLMPNHVHLISVPGHKDSLSGLFRVVHRQYTRMINRRNDWQGHLWQERFHSVVMDERHLAAAARYIELNPVRAGLCDQPQDWRWSSVHAHLSGKDDLVLSVEPMLRRFPDWNAYLSSSDQNAFVDQLRKHTRTGRPFGTQSFLNRLESITGQRVRKSQPGPKNN